MISNIRDGLAVVALVWHEWFGELTMGSLAIPTLADSKLKDLSLSGRCYGLPPTRASGEHLPVAQRTWQSFERNDNRGLTVAFFPEMC